MVKRQKEKQYQSAREHRSNQQLRAGSAGQGSTTQKRLPFNCCALSLVPYENPVCNRSGIVFDNSAILPFILKNGTDPVTGRPMTTRDLITLNMDKSEEGKWQCPVLTKPFTEHTKIIAIIQDPPGNEANVYSYEAYHELNVKPKNYEDLTSGLKFNKNKHVIVLNDPDSEEHKKMRDINNFHHTLNARQLQSSSNTGNDDVRHSVTASRIMDAIAKEKKKKKKRETTDITSKDAKKMKIYTDEVDGRQLTSGKCSASLTSTVMEITHENDAREATEEEILDSLFATMKKRKKKGYVTLHTSLGDLGLELDCDIAPRTCMNFLGLVEAGKYNGTKFHRLIPNFMIQGGKPPKGQEESSIWGPAFADEFDDRLKHIGAGVLSMANSGAGTNKRQFFITFKSCQHLDRKHSIFGKVVQGMDSLKKMEHIPTDKKDRPMEEVIILSAEVLVNPVVDAQQFERERIQDRAEAKRKEAERKKSSALGGWSKSKPLSTAAGSVSNTSEEDGSKVVGKYLPTVAAKTAPKSKIDKQSNNVQGDIGGGVDQIPFASRLKPPPKKTSFGNFSGW